MKAIAKHDCHVTVAKTLEDLNPTSIEIKEGQILDYPVYKDKRGLYINGKSVDRCVIYKLNAEFIFTYQKDFLYEHEYSKTIKKTSEEQDEFTCVVCDNKLPINFMLQTVGYCYRCDPNITKKHRKILEPWKK